MSRDVALAIIRASVPADIEQIRRGIIISPRELHGLRAPRSILPLSLCREEALAGGLVAAPVFSMGLASFPKRTQVLL